MARTYQKRPYRGIRRFIRSCRTGGSCPYCRGGRTYNARRRKAAADAQLDDYRKGSRK